MVKRVEVADPTGEIGQSSDNCRPFVASKCLITLNGSKTREWTTQILQLDSTAQELDHDLNYPPTRPDNN